jgi:hypothetical protein
MRKSGLSPLTNYQVNIIYCRAVWSGNRTLGPFSLYQTITVQAPTDASGNFEVTGTIPNEDGYATMARSNCAVIPVPS